MPHHALFPLIIALTSLLLQPDEVEIVFAGDAMQHQSQLDAARRPGGRFDYSDCFREVAPLIASADYAVVNLECPLGGAPYSGYPMFCAPDAYAEALRDAGFDLALTANNHMLDRRDRGLRRTIAALDSLGIPHTGIHAPAPAADGRKPFIADIGGFNVAFLNYTYGTNGIKHGPGVAVDYIDTAMIRRDITAARRAGAEIVTACMHWGVEYRLLPEKSQRALADRIRRMGADIVMGGHPHVIQPMELTADSVSGKRALTVYSLGNFISGMRTDDTRGGAIATVTLRRDSLGRAYVAAANYRLLFTLTPTPGSGENFQLRPADKPVGDPTREQQRKRFVERATDIFDRHNINVPADTASIVSTVSRRALRRRHYLSIHDTD